MPRTDPNTIGNRVKRSAVAAKQRRDRRREQAKGRKERKREREEYDRVHGGGSKRARRSSSASDSHSSDAGSQSGSGSGSDGDGDSDSDGSAPAPKRGRDKGKKARGAAGDAAAADTEKPKKPVLLVPRTMESEREADHTVVEADDEEAGGGEGLDEFARYFAGADKEPRLLLTTSQKPSAKCYAFMMELVNMFPTLEFYPRGTYSLKDIIGYANNRGFSNVVVLNESNKKINGLWMVHLPEGPTAKFKVSGIVLSKEIPNAGRAGGSVPEVILNNFATRLGHTVGRLLASLFPPAPEFRGRRVITFHNQRDFIFVRHHRYIFDSATKARLQESGPRFTLRLRSLQHGTFDTSSGEYEWIHKREMETSRRRFFL
eukprot:TRINITY_DN1296_c0_g6_i1.p2 TRINITY_DN1296_c0_g6~~TRINITY_DN1296_c0_g6_i1.p2  ORF type:complete len:374 (-),score=161.63 TRINITY_DN1296_c0_g6_i1:60-1181(-)